MSYACGPAMKKSQTRLHQLTSVEMPRQRSTSISNSSSSDGKEMMATEAVMEHLRHRFGPSGTFEAVLKAGSRPQVDIEGIGGTPLRTTLAPWIRSCSDAAVNTHDFQKIIIQSARGMFSVC